MKDHIGDYINSSGEMETIIKLVIQENLKADTEKIGQACYSEVRAALGKPSAILFKNVFTDLIAKVSKN